MSDDSAADLIASARIAIALGQTAVARRTLARVVHADKENGEAWWLLSQVVDEAQRAECERYAREAGYTEPELISAQAAEGQTTRLEMPTPVSSPAAAKRRNRNLLILAGLFVLWIGQALFFGNNATTSTTPSAPARRQPLPESNYTILDVRELAKNPERFRGMPIQVEGEVLSIVESDGFTTLQVWVRYPGGSEFDREAVAVGYDGTLPGVYEDTKVVVFGIGSGEFTGTNAMGGTISQPLIDADIVR